MAELDRSGRWRPLPDALTAELSLVARCIKDVVRWVICLVVTGCLAAPGALADAADKPQRTIPCAEMIDVTTFPFLGSSQRRYQSRLVLGAVSVPPAFLDRSYPTEQTRWPHFAKHGMVVKSGASVTITVPRAWRKRVAISWGNALQRVFHTIRIAACDPSPKQGYAYAGGFFLQSPSACVPLVSVVGGRQQKVWFGIGRRCR